MRHNRHGHNCHGVAVDVFMTMAVRHRWQEVEDFFPDDYVPPPMDLLTPDLSWIALRTIENMTEEDWETAREWATLTPRFAHFRRVKWTRRTNNHDGHGRKRKRRRQTELYANQN